MDSRSAISRLLAKKTSKLETVKRTLESNLRTGLYYRLNNKKRFFLLNKFQKLIKRVNDLRWQMKIAAAGGTFAAIATTQDAVAQSKVGPFVLQNRAHNPLRWPLRQSEQKPTAVDLDNDGDYDIVAGEDFGYIRIYLNEGTPERPGFTEYFVLDDGGNPIQGYGGAPAFADLTGDGNLDLIFAQHEAYPTDEILFYAGNGGIPGDDDNPLLFTEQTDAWDSILKTGNPFDNISGNTVGTNLTLTFVNFDGDSDLDVLIGHDYSNIGDGEQVHYYENDGNGNFSLQSFGASVVGYSSYRAAPQLADIDEDGNDDLIVGRQNGDLLFYRGDGIGNYSQQSGPWDEINKTGNPFFGIRPGRQSAPAFVDLDNDGDLDLVLGTTETNKYGGLIYNNSPLFYFENTGDGVYEQQYVFFNPFDGIELGDAATAFFVDLDGDDDLDAVLGGKYDGSNETIGDEIMPVAFTNLGPGPSTGSFGEFVYNPPIFTINGLLSDYGFYPLMVNLDGDADLEVVAGTTYDDIRYFDLEDGVYVERTGVDSPFDNVDVGYNMRPALIDIDNDGDLDLFVSGELFYPYYGTIKFFENTGSADLPEFTERTEDENPLHTVHEEYSVAAALVDIDHDGDLDAIITESGPAKYNGNDLLVYENQGSASSPSFSPLSSHPLMDIELPVAERYENSLAFVDIDGDGDLDLFLGIGDGNQDQEGRFWFYRNDNPTPVTTLATTVLNYSFTGGPLAVDANLTLSDSDSDLIIQAVVSIQSYQQGDESLSFTPQAPITGTFDDITGVLTLQGKASLATYQSVLRTVMYTYSGPDPGARKGSGGRVKAVSRTIAFTILDEDLTSPLVASRTINVASQLSAPVISANTLTTVINNSVSIDLTSIVSDPDGNLDPLSFAILPNVAPTPARVGNATISGNILTIDYQGTNFAGTDYVTIEACDLTGLCSTAEIQIDVAGDVIVRNGISPNGDGLNDFFRLDNITALGPENKVQIFNRWGDKVFEIDNYDNTTRRFEGVSDDGKELGSGVYFYKIEFSNGLESLEGYLTLKR